MEERFLEDAERLLKLQSDDAIRRIRGLAAPENPPGFDGQHCIDCEEVIPLGRLAMGRCRCVDCQTIKENRV